MTILWSFFHTIKDILVPQKCTLLGSICSYSNILYLVIMEGVPTVKKHCSKFGQLLSVKLKFILEFIIRMYTTLGIVCRPYYIYLLFIYRSH